MNNLDRAMIEFGRQVDRGMEDFAAWARVPVKDPQETVHWFFVLSGLVASTAGLVALIVGGIALLAKL